MTKEPKENMALVCSDCGDEQYFQIKEMEKELKGFVYCMFKADHEQINTERMWIKIEFGDQKKGVGYLSNQPKFISNLKEGDRCVFYTTKEGITRAELQRH
mgnify:CR=1 FL=1